PRLWRVSRGDHVLWLLGTLDPLPRKMIWKSREVESVLGEVQAVIPTNPSVSVHANPFTWVRLYFQWRGVQVMDKNGHLKDALPANLYARVLALLGRYDNGDHRIERLKPIFAALRLYREALDHEHLAPGNQAQDTVLKLARHHDVPIRQSKLKIEEPRDLVTQLGQIPLTDQVSCLEAVVERLETGVEPMKEEARAWSLGDVATLRQLEVPKTIDVCTAAVSTSAQSKQLIEQANASWNHEVQLALANNRSTLALKPIHDLLGTHGVLATLKAQGYQVEGP
ncbi:MAG TPA: TraB/GumN family protein, partial [Steroidobacteraceae bacterium]|nr:TraB/GumN family protein [Steroidobacteraceae bacterium]